MITMVAEILNKLLQADKLPRPKSSENNRHRTVLAILDLVYNKDIGNAKQMKGGEQDANRWEVWICFIVNRLRSFNGAA